MFKLTAGCRIGPLRRGEIHQLPYLREIAIFLNQFLVHMGPLRKPVREVNFRAAYRIRSAPQPFADLQRQPRLVH